jgi:hypothetical protein
MNASSLKHTRSTSHTPDYFHFAPLETSQTLHANTSHKHTKKTPSSSDINNTTNQLTATNDYIKKGKALIQEQQKSISKMLAYNDMENAEIRMILDKALETASNNTINHRIAANKDLYTFTSNAAIQSLHDSLRQTSTDEDQKLLAEYIELKKQLSATNNKLHELAEHYDNNFKKEFICNEKSHVFKIRINI